MAPYRRAVRTVTLTLGGDLLVAVDRAAGRLGTTRSAFIREALRAALERAETPEERLHREGYRRKPVPRGEFSVRETNQVRLGWADD